MKDTISAKRIETRLLALVDDAGQERCTLEVTGTGASSAVVMHMLDNEGCPRLTLSVDDEGASISVMDQQCGSSVTLNSNVRGNGISLKDKQGFVRVSAGGCETRKYSLTLYDEHGRTAEEFDCRLKEA
ncbi:hypothetical protein [Roseimaritima multifibrata]|uniref:hypothetical protein n=1 Tax=Roseimaritima multifibrata TaxID=1930274 RepID=UPI0011A6B10A|nr:hypothetical protein [Roseimaritima multifibrata]